MRGGCCYSVKVKYKNKGILSIEPTKTGRLMFRFVSFSSSSKGILILIIDAKYNNNNN